MAEYIKLEDAEKILFDIMYGEPPYFNSVAGIKRWVKEQFADVPSIDIVRCDECKYWTARKSSFGEVVHFCGYEIRGTITASEDFCSYGERK